MSLDAVGSFLTDVSEAAAPWVQAFTGKVVTPTPGTAATLQAQLQLQSQAQLTQKAPVTSGLLANPLIWIVVLGLLLIGLIWAIR